MPLAKMSCNSFYMFTMEIKRREEAKGARLTFDEVHPMASAEWEHLSQDEKQIYKERAREYKNSEEFRNKRRTFRLKQPNSKEKKKMRDTSPEENEDAEFFDEVDEAKFRRRRLQDQKDLHTSLIWTLGADSCAKRILNERFFMLAVQNYVDSLEHFEFVPAEVAVVEFSIAHGIHKQFSTILNPINMPEKFKNASEMKAATTHRIIWNNLPSEAREDYRVVVENVKSFYINKITSQFRMFVLSEQFNSVQGAIKTLRQKTGSKTFVPPSKVACIEDLFDLLCSLSKCETKKSDLKGFSDLLEGTNWDFEPHTLCEFHSHKQSKFCALGIARKSCYYLFERLNNVIEFSLTSKHIPPMPFNVNFRNPNPKLLEFSSQQESLNITASVGEFKIKPMPVKKVMCKAEEYAPTSRCETVNSGSVSISSSLVSNVCTMHANSKDLALNAIDDMVENFDKAVVMPSFPVNAVNRFQPPNSIVTPFGPVKNPLFVKPVAKVRSPIIVTPFAPMNLPLSMPPGPDVRSPFNVPPFVPLPKPEFIDNDVGEIRRPTTKSICSKIIEQKKAKAHTSPDL